MQASPEDLGSYVGIQFSMLVKDTPKRSWSSTSEHVDMSRGIVVWLTPKRYTSLLNALWCIGVLLDGLFLGFAGGLLCLCHLVSPHLGAVLKFRRSYAMACLVDKLHGGYSYGDNAEISHGDGTIRFLPSKHLYGVCYFVLPGLPGASAHSCRVVPT
jgi:hypothetical protein